MSNELPTIIAQNAEPDYSKGVGWGSITLSCDGEKALEELLLKIKLNEYEEGVIPAIEGTLMISVRDKSSGGQTKKFPISFIFQEKPKEEEKGNGSK